MQRAIRTCLMRGGSSKGVFLRSTDVPPAGPMRDAVVLRLFGSPDPRQIDGLGGADVLTSKLAIVGPPTVADADVDYTFGQVSFVSGHVDYTGNCGNISAAVGPFAIDSGLVPRVRDGVPTQLVRIHNTNTGAVLRALVPVGRDGAQVDGEAFVAGVPGTGAEIELDFSATQGSVTGSLLPTGLRSELLEVPREEPGSSVEQFEATLLDAGQPTVFVWSAALGMAGNTSTTALDSNPGLLRRIERIRGAAAVKMGIVERWEDSERLSPYTPFVVILAAPPPKASWDLSATCVFMQRVHKAYPVTGSVATAAAVFLPGTLPNVAAREPHGRIVRIGHPSGVLEVIADVRDGEKPTLVRAAISRTARRLMDGNAYIPWRVWPATDAAVLRGARDNEMSE
eukprot:TRINITY_DN73717_c0_g1_i1.p1 TRINITY_DN73717_c0_g1~~TRINITY_DN73717_c0_g1_i1.p1  ORF type:complete len:397 (+),score=65.48 TRINITY_DN73717_c0_g1_i1:101-1291(+)